MNTIPPPRVHVSGISLGSCGAARDNDISAETLPEECVSSLTPVRTLLWKRSERQRASELKRHRSHAVTVKMNEPRLGGRGRTGGFRAELTVGGGGLGGEREGAFAAGLDAKRSCRKVGEEHTEQLQDEQTEGSILQAGQPFKHPSVTVTYSNPLNQPPPVPPSSGDTDPLPT